MSYRKIDIEFNDFPKEPNSGFKDKASGGYVKSLNIDLVKLTAQYKIEEYGDHDDPLSYTEYNALKYLLRSTDLFKFRGGHPGVSRDSRKENSRVLGQSMCRYLNYYHLDAQYTAHISTYLNKDLGADFNGLRLERNGSGDTPDFISVKSDKTPFLSEAKGRHKVVRFGDNDFGEWRKQFDRIKVLDNSKELGLKGYIVQVAIANEENKMNNSRILIEDPWTSGERRQNEQNDLYPLIKCGHYKEILDKIGLSYIGESLVYKDKLTSNKFTLPVYVNKSSDKEYVGRFSRFDSEHLIQDFFFRSTSDTIRFLRGTSDYFYGIEKSILLRLLSVARGNFSSLSEIQYGEFDRNFNESSSEFRDGSMLCRSGLIGFIGYEQF